MQQRQVIQAASSSYPHRPRSLPFPRPDPPPPNVRSGYGRKRLFPRSFVAAVFVAVEGLVTVEEELAVEVDDVDVNAIFVRAPGA